MDKPMPAAAEIVAALLPSGQTAEPDAAEKAATVLEELMPATLQGALEAIRRAGAAIDRASEADELARRIEDRWESIRAKAAGTPEPPRTLLLSEVDPPQAPGLWVPELLEMAGAESAPWDVAGEPARAVSWEEIVAFAPETIILILGGRDAHEAIEEAEALTELPGWYDLPAVRAGECYTADAATFFDSPGPKLAEAAGILATILHPETFTEMLPPYSVRIFPPALLEPPKE